MHTHLHVGWDLIISWLPTHYILAHLMFLKYSVCLVSITTEQLCYQEMCVGCVCVWNLTFRHNDKTQGLYWLSKKAILVTAFWFLRWGWSREHPLLLLQTAQKIQSSKFPSKVNRSYLGTVLLQVRKTKWSLRDLLAAKLWKAKWLST